jgi:peptide/nickel transport system permease protein
MLTFTIRRLAFAVPTLLAISFIIFAILELSPGDPMAHLPLTIRPPRCARRSAEAMGLASPS